MENHPTCINMKAHYDFVLSMHYNRESDHVWCEWSSVLANKYKGGFGQECTQQGWILSKRNLGQKWRRKSKHVTKVSFITLSQKGCSVSHWGKVIWPKTIEVVLFFFFSPNRALSLVLTSTFNAFVHNFVHGMPLDYDGLKTTRKHSWDTN